MRSSSIDLDHLVEGELHTMNQERGAMAEKTAVHGMQMGARKFSSVVLMGVRKGALTKKL